MKKTFIYQVILFLTIILCTETSAQVTVTPGFDGTATIKAIAEYTNLKNAGNGQYLNFGKITGPTSVNGATWVYSPSTNGFSLSYDKTNITSILFDTKTNNSGDLGDLNYIEIDILSGQNGTTVAIQNLVVNSHSLGNFTASAGSSLQMKVKGIDFTNGLSLSGSIVLASGQGNNSYIKLRFGYLAPPPPPPTTDNLPPVVTSVSASPNPALVNTTVTLSATISDVGLGGSNIENAQYSFDEVTWFNMTPVNVLDSPTESFTANLENLSCGLYTIYVHGKDVVNSAYGASSFTNLNVFKKGSISGIVDVGGNGVGGVIVKLIDLNGDPLDQTTTFSNPGATEGYYEFTELYPSDYRVWIVTPLGFACNSPEAEPTIEYNCNNDVTVNFSLTAVPIVNDARSKGYWKHQFDVYLKNKGTAQETEAALESYVEAIGDHYIPHFNDIFDATINWQYWSDILSYGGPDMYQKAKAQLAALVLNMASLKISQLEVATGDGRNVADVITHASTILSNTGSTKAQQELAKNIAEAVCNQVMIAAGLVPDYNILYKNGSWVEGTAPTQYALNSNYPNPFNPTTVISYAIANDGFVTLKVYDLLGREVATLVNDRQVQGIYSVNFDASQLTSGIYFYKLQSGSFVSTKKMMLVK